MNNDFSGSCENSFRFSLYCTILKYNVKINRDAVRAITF